jgi:hypothetical protein
MVCVTIDLNQRLIGDMSTAARRGHAVPIAHAGRARAARIVAGLIHVPNFAAQSLPDAAVSGSGRCRQTVLRRARITAQGNGAAAINGAL